MITTPSPRLLGTGRESTERPSDSAATTLSLPTTRNGVSVSSLRDAGML